ncbi:FAD-dependent oxidoreductase [Formosa haliotis]|uniref:FAD-dependent oxidoreductase n=1 Tax=Formosa haliotis TaxID=1555194 RepID=UPI000826169B|nr:FAD-dependent oxidoreductase [Formosa haliotis]
MKNIHDVGIIGGGISGVVIALELAKHKVDSILFEQEKSVVNGPPFCHLHAGGNLYPDISIDQCKVLMKQSIDMARLFPHSIDERPTFISIPKSETYEPYIIAQRLEDLVSYYKRLVTQDPLNEILGPPEHYYKAYSQADILALAEKPTVKRPATTDEWMTNTLKLVDHTKLKTPVFMVQEYGWNLFRFGAQAQLALNKTENCSLNTNTNVKKIKDVRDKNLGYNWEIQTKDTTYNVKYLVNSCGFKTGIFDESLALNPERLIEFKAAYISKWQPIEGLIPELIFHGKRGTPNGMAQLTPYCDDYYQIHGMTNDITLFEQGLVRSKNNSKQPKFNEAISKKLKQGWDISEIKRRTENGIALVSKFVPTFKTATVGGPPLYGAQQIPGDDPNLRVGEVSFPCKSYARSEIIKASSALTVAHQIIEKIQEEGIIPEMLKDDQHNDILSCISKTEIDELAETLAVQRGYPKALSRLVIDKD